MSLEIKITRSQLENNDVLFLVAASLYGYFVDNSYEERETTFSLFDGLFIGIRKLASTKTDYPDRLEELRRIYQTFKIKEYFTNILKRLGFGLGSVIIECPYDIQTLNHVQDYLSEIFIIKIPEE